jgi:hypothetical protein
MFASLVLAGYSARRAVRVGARHGCGSPRVMLPFFVVGLGHDPRQAADCLPGAASFAEGRTRHREWVRRNGRLGDIHTLDDRLDHDVYELMG